MKDGFVLINKESGPTSHRIVDIMRELLKIRRIGHTGTLDPMAEGLMIICIGRATKLANEILNDKKGYEAKIEFGYETDTLDRLGNIVKIDSFYAKSEDIKREVESLIDMKKQIPPKISSIKINGMKAYKKARLNHDFVMPERNIEIYRSNYINFSQNTLQLSLEVSKGTYIRSIARDLGYSLNSLATLVYLKRVSIGNHNLSSSLSINQIEQMGQNNDFSFIKRVEDFFPSYEQINLSEYEYRKYINGIPIPLQGTGKKKIYFKNKFLGLGLIKESLLKSYKYKISG